MKKSFSLVVALPGRQLLTFEAKHAVIPSNNGHLGILAGRQAMLATIDAGIIEITDIEDHRHIFAATGGFCEMFDNHATLLCDSLVSAEEIDVSQPLPPNPLFLRDTSGMTEKEKIEYVSALLHQKLKRRKIDKKAIKPQEAK